MKTMKFFSVVGCMAAMFLTSCLNDDGDDSNTPLTKEQVAACYNLVKGDHQGDLIYAAKNPHDVKDNADTVKISWSITNDSTMIIRKFPTKLLAANLDKAAATDELVEALSEAPDQDIECRIGFYATSPVSFLINPVSPAYNIKVNDVDHKINVVFYANSYVSRGEYYASDKELAMQIVEAVIYRDEKQTSYLNEAVPFIFVENLKSK